MENIVDYKDDDEIIDTDILFDTIISYNINSGIKREIMSKVEELLEDKNKKIIELENEVALLKTRQENLHDVVNYIVKDLHYSAMRGLRNVQPIYDESGKIIDAIVNEGWIDRRKPILYGENGGIKRYKLDGKIYELKGNGIIVEIKET
jgi:hypothetical protein